MFVSGGRRIPIYREVRWAFGDTGEEVGVRVGGLYFFARDDVEEFGCDCG